MVFHVLSDGTITKDITGRVVKVRDAENFYNLLQKINERAMKNEKKDRRVIK